MQVNKYLLMFIILAIGVMGIAMGSIGIQYYNKCDTLKDDKDMKRNRNFLIGMLIVSVLMTLYSLYRLGTSGKAKRAYSNMQAMYASRFPMTQPGAAPAPMMAAPPSKML